MSRTKTIFLGNTWRPVRSGIIYYTFDPELISALLRRFQATVNKEFADTESLREVDRDIIRDVIARDFIDRAGMKVQELDTSRGFDLSRLNRNVNLLLITQSSLSPGNNGASATVANDDRGDVIKIVSFNKGLFLRKQPNANKSTVIHELMHALCSAKHPRKYSPSDTPPFDESATCLTTAMSYHCNEWKACVDSPSLRGLSEKEQDTRCDGAFPDPAMRDLDIRACLIAGHQYKIGKVVRPQVGVQFSHLVRVGLTAAISGVAIAGNGSSLAVHNPQEEGSYDGNLVMGLFIASVGMVGLLVAKILNNHNEESHEQKTEKQGPLSAKEIERRISDGEASRAKYKGFILFR